MKQQLSILIVTKNRSALLTECLLSLVAQKQKPQEIVLVDNGSTDNTKEVVSAFQKRLPIRYFYTNVFGYPKIYNHGLKRCRGDWVIFFDDDCVASAGWLSAMWRSIQIHPGAVIQGKTKSIPMGNIYAEIMGDHYANWMRANLAAPGRLRTFDNKNLCIPRPAIRSRGLFDESLIGGSEDIELGLRYSRSGIPIYYQPKALAYHHERTTMFGFLQQHMRIARSEYLLGKHLSGTDKKPMIFQRKFLFHIKSAFVREWFYLRKGRITDAIRLPVLYILLACVRIYGYVKST